MKKGRNRKALPREPFQLVIEKLSHEGRGIAYNDGKVVFVDDALAGESVNAVYTARHNNFDEARALEILHASSQRVTPPCQYALVCGGCSLQHFDSVAQLAFKESVLHEKLHHSTATRDYLKLAPVTGPVLAYRRKARLAARFVARKEKVLVGFREKNSSFITDMDSCAVLDSQVGSLLPALGNVLLSLSVHRHIPQVEVAVGDPHSDGNTLALIIRHLQALNAADIEILQAFAREQRLDIYLQPEGPASVRKLEPTDGNERLYYQLPAFNLSMAFHPLDFTQINADINKKMLSRAIDLLDLGEHDRVLDLFCGLGNFTLPMATLAESVLGIEGSGEMVARGQENARRNQIDNVEFQCADLSKAPAQSPWSKMGFTKVLLDPPRSGALEILPEIIALRPEKIVYISCDPATLARDAGILAQKGYKLMAAGVMDMFPHTAHVESIALFEPC
ncbi:MAG: 23S rRNA (uracil(1939)-C(5))-methyltransferase RlmD [Pseudomonadales bacterium]|nr:23S rRNA (uracil(1939)-C(5))-methyltransferase RlmD [Pseudomonadales bacterium]